MHALGFFTSSQPPPKGFTLVEMLVCLGLLSIMASLTIPGLQLLLERNHVGATRDQLMNDLQAARIRALQRGETLQLTRLQDCPWGTSINTDWSCGWQLVVKADQTVLLSTQQQTALQITFAQTGSFEISARGDLGTVGDRWVIKSRQAALNVSVVLCLSSAGRLRWQAGETCSN